MTDTNTTTAPAPDLTRLEELLARYNAAAEAWWANPCAATSEAFTEAEFAFHEDVDANMPALLAAARREAALRAEIEAALKLLGNEDVKWPQPHPELLTATAGARRTLQRWAEEIKALEAERDALRAALTFAHQLMPDVSQLLDGWHADGTAWTEWDAGVRSAVSELQRRLESLLGRAALGGGATTEGDHHA